MHRSASPQISVSYEQTPSSPPESHYRAHTPRMVVPQHRSSGIGGHSTIHVMSGIGGHISENKDTGIGKACLNHRTRKPSVFSISNRSLFGSTRSSPVPDATEKRRSLSPRPSSLQNSIKL
ncbi:hypothetical protein LPJ58_007304 [Coemansia sp. RSA 1591]|nr:hypothetical protein LPJ58_007304 [Coemansia sp. RSA 1591]